MQRTRDTLWRGQVILWQPARGHGYRFNLDPVLLADFAPRGAHVLDLGAGVGVIGILLLASGKAERVTAVEVQPALAELAAENARENGLADRMRVVTGDLRSLALPRADAVVLNPPYHPLRTGRGAPQEGRHAARHERHGTLADFVRAAAAAAPGGPVAAIVPARRAGDLERELRAVGLGALRRRDVLPRAGGPSELCLVEGSAGSGERLEPPLVVHGPEGREFTPEIRRMLREDGRAEPEPVVSDAATPPGAGT